MQLCDWRRHKRDVVHVAILQYYGIGEVERLGLVTVNERAELVGSRRHVSHSEVALAVGNPAADPNLPYRHDVQHPGSSARGGAGSPVDAVLLFRDFLSP